MSTCKLGTSGVLQLDVVGQPTYYQIGREYSYYPVIVVRPGTVEWCDIWRWVPWSLSDDDIRLFSKAFHHTPLGMMYHSYSVPANL